MEASPPRRRRLWPWALAAIPILLAILSWRLTAPLDTTPPSARPIPPVDPKPTRVERPTAWPESSLEGEPAKLFLLSYLEAAKARLDRVADYTATFRKQERIRGKLGPEQTIAIKVRRKPFSVYFKYQTPTPGREILFVEGAHDNKLIVHNADFSGVLLPRVPVDPKGSIAMAENRHPINEVGLANLTDRLIAFRKLDLGDPDARTTLDRIVDDRGRTWYRSLHSHQVRNPDRPFKRIEVLYDPATNLPHQIASDDWPEPGDPDGPIPAERYVYDDVKLDAPLAEIDFDLSNPAYGFRRY